MELAEAARHRTHLDPAQSRRAVLVRVAEELPQAALRAGHEGRKGREECATAGRNHGGHSAAVDHGWRDGSRRSVAWTADRCAGRGFDSLSGVRMTKAEPGTVLLALAAIFVLGCERPPANVALVTEASPPASTGGSALRVLPSRTRADRDVWRARLAWPEDCERAFTMTDASADSGLVVYELE